MFSTRGHLELFVGAIVLVVLLATAESRSVTMTDRSQHQALRTAGATPVRSTSESSVIGS